VRGALGLRKVLLKTAKQITMARASLDRGACSQSPSEPPNCLHAQMSPTALIPGDVLAAADCTTGISRYCQRQLFARQLKAKYRRCQHLMFLYDGCWF